MDAAADHAIPAATAPLFCARAGAADLDVAVTDIRPQAWLPLTPPTGFHGCFAEQDRGAHPSALP